MRDSRREVQYCFQIIQIRTYMENFREIGGEKKLSDDSKKFWIKFKNT